MGFGPSHQFDGEVGRRIAAVSNVFHAWSNGRWISLDLQSNRYSMASTSVACPEERERLTETTARLRDCLNSLPAFVPPVHLVWRYARAAHAARLIRSRASLVNSTFCVHHVTVRHPWEAKRSIATPAYSSICAIFGYAARAVLRIPWVDIFFSIPTSHRSSSSWV